MSALFHAANLGKRGITLDLAKPEGVELARRLVEQVDVVCENFTPRVMDGFGLGYDELARVNPGLVMLRLPAFGLTGPWRDRPGFAQTMEQLTGMAWVTGYEDGPPIIPGGVVDPMVGAHAALALVAALDHRARTGEGRLVEVPMIEVATAVTAEQVIEHSARGRLAGRRGAGGVHRCDGEDAWIAVDRDTDPMDGDERAAWCASRTAEEAEAALLADGIPAAAVVPAFLALDDPQLAARDFFQPIEHAVVGTHHYPGWPARLSGGPRPGEWWTGPAPRLDEHTDEVLVELLGMDEAELSGLRARGVVGDRLAAR
jgi:crotonobetainyl-CoA:carnitine CoA-transferase CaiB-like acyl-CoA transferase